MKVSKLNKVAASAVIPTSPFNFDATFHKPDHFASGDNYWEPSIKWQTFRWQKTNLGVVYRNNGSIERPEIIIDIYGESKLATDFVDRFTVEIIYRYNLNLGLKPFYEKFSKHQILGPVIEKTYGMRPGHQDSLYEYLVIGLMLQNCTVKRSIQMMQILFEHYGTLLEFDGKKLWCFWEPGSLFNVTEEELRSLKIGYRAKSLKRIDDAFVRGEIDEIHMRKLSRDEQMQELLKLYGVGPATVWYLLFDVFHHWDFFNHISPWEQKIYSKIFFNTDPVEPVSVEKLMHHFDQFGDYKQLAVHYLWEDLWWRRKNGKADWLNALIRT